MMALRMTLLMLAVVASASSLAQIGNYYVSPPLDQPLPGPMMVLQPNIENGIAYLCGGIGEEEANAMKQAAPDYDLMVTFAASNGAYLAGVNVDIADARGRSLLKISCDAPIMLVDFEKPGNYRIRGKANGRTITSNMRVREGGKLKSVAMAWPVKMVELDGSPGLRAGQSSGTSGTAGTSGSQ